MILYYEELNDEEKNAVTKVIRTLLKQTFVLERKYDKKSGRLVYNKEFRTIDLHQEFLREYFKISGIELRENLHLGVFYIEGETLIGEKISRLSTIYLLILKLLYDEHMAEASSNTSVYTSLGEIHEKINDFHLMRTLPSITEMRRSIALLKKYQIIEPLDVLEELNDETRMMIYPCVNVVLLGDDIRRLIESFSKEEVDSEFDEDEAAILALSKICLNNWHYIDQKVLSFNDGINFFTGHSGSGKSTVIDAMQIVLYANTDGRGFFNKAAADDSDRNLIEYLRGMVAVGEKDEVTYLRNKNFSTTIVLEFTQTESDEKECLGVVFDVDTARNDTSRLFFWHKGGILENAYRTEEHAMTISELRKYMQKNFKKEDFYFGTSNERFRKQMYDIYLGGLDMEKFPRLFKRAIPFKMNIKLEDFVKEYICMEQDIHIEDMQESVMQYGRMRQRIEDTLKEAKSLEEIKESFDKFKIKKVEQDYCQYRMNKLDVLKLKSDIHLLQQKIEDGEKDLKTQEENETVLEKKLEKLAKEYDALVAQIAGSGYDQIATRKKDVQELLGQLNHSVQRWEQTSKDLKKWCDLDITPNQAIWDIEKFEQGDITEDDLNRLKHTLDILRKETEEERQDNASALRALKKQEKSISDELKELKKGNKAYPKEVLDARYELQTKLSEKCGDFVKVNVLADLLDMKDERWHKAVEGYLGSNKLTLIVEPKYVKDAMEIYRDMDQKKYWRISIADTQKIDKQDMKVEENALSEEVLAEQSYVKKLIESLIGRVIKCETIDELRNCRTGITPDGMLYKNFQLKRLDPKQYTRNSYIGDNSLRHRIKELEKEKDKIFDKKDPLEKEVLSAAVILDYEYLPQSAEEYLKQQETLERAKERQEEYEDLENQLTKLREGALKGLEEERDQNRLKQEDCKQEINAMKEAIWATQNALKECRQQIIDQNEALIRAQNELPANGEYEQQFAQEIEKTDTEDYERLKKRAARKYYDAGTKKEEEYRKLVEVRTAYLREYPNRTFSAVDENNDVYDKLYKELSSDHMEMYREKAAKQAKTAMEHFKDDFVYKIRSAIREAYQRRDELNRMISGLDFGKDKYQFKITRNTGADGKYYPMFMDDSLNIDPSVLNTTMDDQMNLFSMEHENKYGELMNELIEIFIPPEGATGEELENAKRDMQKYSDYRTYLSFDMEQIVDGDEKLTIGLSKMIKKNSGGEGQNPLYVALLASFAQAYGIHLSPKVRRNPSIRLVVLDEAFSKMDAEKVASCIDLIRNLGFQAIISATNDKIQNYLENVDKTFVYANPNKKNISIQEFEKCKFDNLVTEE